MEAQFCPPSEQCPKRLPSFRQLRKSPLRRFAWGRITKEKKDVAAAIVLWGFAFTKHQEDPVVRNCLHICWPRGRDPTSRWSSLGLKHCPFPCLSWCGRTSRPSLLEGMKGEPAWWMGRILLKFGKERRQGWRQSEKMSPLWS